MSDDGTNCATSKLTESYGHTRTVVRYELRTILVAHLVQRRVACMAVRLAVQNATRVPTTRHDNHLLLCVIDMRQKQRREVLETGLVSTATRHNQQLSPQLPASTTASHSASEMSSPSIANCESTNVTKLWADMKLTLERNQTVSDCLPGSDHPEIMETEKRYGRDRAPCVFLFLFLSYWLCI